MAHNLRKGPATLFSVQNKQAMFVIVGNTSMFYKHPGTSRMDSHIANSAMTLSKQTGVTSVWETKHDFAGIKWNIVYTITWVGEIPSKLYSTESKYNMDAISSNKSVRWFDLI